MAFGSFDRKSSSQPMAEINMVPLIDVALVLLVIFIVTAPLLTHAVKLDLPKASSTADTLSRPRTTSRRAFGSSRQRSNILTSQAGRSFCSRRSIRRAT